PYSLRPLARRSVRIAVDVGTSSRAGATGRASDSVTHLTLASRRHSGPSFAGSLTGVLTGVCRSPRYGRNSDISTCRPAFGSSHVAELPLEASVLLKARRYRFRPQLRSFP